MLYNDSLHKALGMCSVNRISPRWKSAFLSLSRKSQIEQIEEMLEACQASQQSVLTKIPLKQELVIKIPRTEML